MKLKVKSRALISSFNCFNYQLSQTQGKKILLIKNRGVPTRFLDVLNRTWCCLEEKKHSKRMYVGKEVSSRVEKFRERVDRSLEGDKPTKLRKENELWSGIITFPNEK